MSIHLRGELGAGKTALVRAVLRELGVTGKVKSPTYTLVEPYEVSRLTLYHFDFYRLHEPEEWSDAGFRDYFNEYSVCLVEWPEKAGSLLPRADLTITLAHPASDQPETMRSVTIEAATPRGLTALQSLSSSAA